jgi:hypothetical protein
MDLLGEVDDQMLKDIGISIGGHRLRTRNAIAKLTAAPAAEANLDSTTSAHETTAASAERRQLSARFRCRGSRSRPKRPVKGEHAATCHALRRHRNGSRYVFGPQG